MPSIPYTEDVFCDPIASSLESSRHVLRTEKGKRLTYDCLNAQVSDMNTVTCRAGHDLKGYTLMACLRGNLNPGVCAKCQDYREDDGENTENI